MLIRWLLGVLMGSRKNRKNRKDDGLREKYERKKRTEAARNREASLAARDIAPLPKVVNARRRGRCRRNFRLFCSTYFPDTFDLEWSPAQLKAVRRIEDSVLRGGLFALAMPRGSGKTALAEVAVIFSMLYGHHEFTVLIGASQDSAEESLDAIKTMIATNDLLLEDFPAACYPIRRLEGIGRRAEGQLLSGRPTRIEWKSKSIVLPTVRKAPSSAAICVAAGIVGQIRGMKYQRPDGRSVRPSLVVIDDPQTDESAYSATQCAKRERIVSGAILGLAGPGRKIAGIMPCTVIRPGDMADRILNRSIHPDWQGERTKMLNEFPKRLDLWDEYWKIRCEELENDGDGSVATRFYADHQSEMDENADHYWPARFNHDEISAIQNAMNLFYRNEHSFRAEYQNDPLPDDSVGSEMLKAEDIVTKLNGFGRKELPIGASHVTAFVDVQMKCLYYTLVAWSKDFSGWVIDYGTFPDQRRRYFTLRDVTNTLQSNYPDRGLEAQIYAGLEGLCRELFGQSFVREDGAELRLDHLMIDANWHASTDVVYQFCKSNQFAAMPAHGRYVGASSKPFSEYKKQPGELVGHDWRVPSVLRRRSVRHTLFDTNSWKTFCYSRLAMAKGEPTSLTLWGSDPAVHQLFAEHITAEYYVRTEGRGRSVEEWKLRPENFDNHWLDCLVGAAVGASMLGCSLTSHQSTEQAINRPKPASFGERARQMRNRRR